MGRTQGPKHRMCRRIGERLCNTEKCPVTRRQQPPGVHGPKGYGRLTEYGTQLREKQKARHIYGVMERQFRRYFDAAAKKSGNTAEHFLGTLERRLDNVVFRLGLAKTRGQARQFISHGWITVNGKQVTIASYQVRVGEIVALKEGAQNSKLWQVVKETRGPVDPVSWLDRQEEKLTGKVVSLPGTDDFPANVNMTLVVEYYSR